MLQIVIVIDKTYSSIFTFKFNILLASNFRHFTGWYASSMSNFFVIIIFSKERKYVSIKLLTQIIFPFTYSKIQQHNTPDNSLLFRCLQDCRIHIFYLQNWSIENRSFSQNLHQAQQLYYKGLFCKYMPLHQVFPEKSLYLVKVSRFPLTYQRETYSSTLTFKVNIFLTSKFHIRYFISRYATSVCNFFTIKF